MRKTLAAALMLSMSACTLSAQDVKQLPAPDKTLNVTLMEALQKRRSNREFDASKAISEQQLSQLLWAACGVNNTERKLLTIPTAINAQDIKVYVCGDV